MSSRAERKVKAMSEWYTNDGKDSDVVLSTKACIVRNIKGYNFMPRLDDKECQSLLETIDKAIDNLMSLRDEYAALRRGTRS